ncbi:sulfurtransferase-like selenium metabolism protein YedF [Desulfovermiculus halophilus]|jgi:selenium metabolism protein YedF|uniref:sulfurtransferase-like selenium metabolism protein YedF n=1 Tax=Desulfovermiculus halophilus TaxID=339722 RepID=UPI000489E7E5|nr:sulfurtransferase-like selenium metabolism protein YedF [Desulfovermiculus halophilus]
MTAITLDCQGLACPQPVLKCKDALSQSQPDRLVIRVDNEAARENVTRFLGSQGYQVVNVRDKDGIFELTAQAGEGTTRKTAVQASPQTGPSPVPRSESGTDAQLVFITSNVIGHGDDVLGEKLMANFLSTLPEMGPSLWRILLLNSAVKLAVTGSPALDSLRKLQDSGVSILVCGTCLDFFHLLDRKEIGETTNMLDVVTSLQLADKVIKV